MVQDDAECPSIGKLINLLEAAQIVHRTGGKDKTVAEILTESFTLKYPHIQINWPSRVLDTVGCTNKAIVHWRCKIVRNTSSTLSS